MQWVDGYRHYQRLISIDFKCYYSFWSLCLLSFLLKVIDITLSQRRTSQNYSVYIFLKSQGFLCSNKGFLKVTFVINTVWHHIDLKVSISVITSIGFYKNLSPIWTNKIFILISHFLLPDAAERRRQPLPSCVMAKCRSKYPSSNDLYTGFKLRTKKRSWDVLFIFRLSRPGVSSCPPRLQIYPHAIPQYPLIQILKL